MRDDANPELMAAWARGWTLTRDAPPPEPVPGGWRIEVDRPDHRWRFLYPRLCKETVAQAHTRLPDPFALKIAAAPQRVRALLGFRWPIDVPAYIMTCDPAAAIRRGTLADGYVLTSESTAPGATLVTIATRDGELAASGRLGMVGDLAVFDRIRTQDDHQRRGLGSAVMSALSRIADQAEAARWALAATVAGRALYETLGWKVHSPYTTVLIAPGS